MKRKFLKCLLSLSVIFFLGSIQNIKAQVISSPTTIQVTSPLTIDYNVSGSLLKKIDLNVSIGSNYANLSIYANDVLVLDNIDIPSAGTHSLNAIGLFNTTGTNQLKLVARGVNVTVNSLDITAISGIDFPAYSNITNQAGITSEASIKYGGPSIADMDNDGDYDLILNNHNEEPSKLFWNDGDGTVTFGQDLARWYRHDLHGSAAGDYDNDGDLDLVIALGGGNGTSPQPPVFYRNDNGTLVEAASSAGLTSGARGRSADWIDMDLDGDLDLFLANAAGVNGANGARHIFYKNNGNGTFNWVNVANIENASGDRTLVTDLNGDNIDDILLFFPLSVWKGNGNFTYTNMTNTWLPAAARGLSDISTVADVDVDNDGDQDLYIARGKTYYQIANGSMDFNPLTGVMDVRDDGEAGTTLYDVDAGNSFILTGFEHVYRSTYNGDFPVYLGSAKTSQLITDKSERLTVNTSNANGWPSSRTNNGLYIGYVGNGQWKVEAVRNGDLYWSIHWTLEEINNVTTAWSPNNKNLQDMFLINNNGVFSDASTQWNIPKGGNNWGVTVGDFNNDSYQDLYVHRFPYLLYRVSDYMLINTGSKFEITTSHAAQTAETKSHGDMGQAFDFDLDGDVDILNGDDEYGKWYLYSNDKADSYNYALVHVGYSPQSNVDPIGAEVILHTPGKNYRRRVGSAGSSFSQSLLNNIHFGLGTENEINSISIRWRNGETKTLNGNGVNKLYDTDNVEPVGSQLTIEAESFTSTGGTYDDSGSGGPGLGVNNATTIINYVNSGDWAEYSINVDSAGEYTIAYQISTPMDNAQVQFVLDGSTISTDDVNNNGSWGDYYTLYASNNIANLSAGSHTIRINASGSNTWQWNMDKIVLTKVSGSVNNAPLADAGSDQTLTAGTTSANLSGSGSDPDGDPITYSWSQISGASVTLTNASSANASVSGLANGNSYSFSLTVSDGELSKTDDVTISVENEVGQQTPYGGAPWAIPGSIESVSFDNGGEGVAYHDATDGNSGSGPRQDENVDTESRIAAGNVGWIAQDEWLEYTVNVTEAGNYNIDVLVASINSNGKFHIEFDGIDKSGVQSVTETGDWGNFEAINISNVALDAGEQIMRVFMDGPSFNLGTISFTSESTPSDTIVIEAETFTATGGTFDDASAGGPGLGVNATASTINYVNADDWADYSVNIPESGEYQIVYQISSPNTGSTISIGTTSEVWNTTTVPNNGGWDDYQALNAAQTANLNAGNQTIRITAGGTNWTWNLDKILLIRLGELKRSASACTCMEHKVMHIPFEDLLVFPNPTDGSLTFKGLSDELHSLHIFNMQGRLLVSKDDIVNNSTISVEHLPIGTYVVRISDGRQSKTIKFLKE